MGPSALNNSSILLSLPSQVLPCGVIYALLCPVLSCKVEVSSSGLIELTLNIYWNDYFISDVGYFLLQHLREFLRSNCPIIIGKC